MKFKVGDKVRVKSSGVEHWIKSKGINAEGNPIYALLDEPGWFEEDDLELVTDPLVDENEEQNNKPVKMILDENLLNENDPIKPSHYRKGEIDLFESWYRTYPFNEFRAGMQMIAERYMKRDKHDRVEDIKKSIETLTRLKEYEELEKSKKSVE